MPKTKPTVVGRSGDRTPAKHGLMDKIAGREAGVIQYGDRGADFLDGAWYDLTAGDGAATENEDWHRSCSPGILAYHAKYAPRGREAKPITVHLHERAPQTFAKLLTNLDRNLPNLPGPGPRYVRVAGNQWRAGHVTYTVHNTPADTATAAHVGLQTAVMLFNDPNNVSQWACPRPLLAELCDRSRWVLMLSTMGCNPAGLKRAKPDERKRWYEHVRSQLDAMANWHDCYLAAIERDKSQWAYLITAPKKWQDSIEEDADKAFGRFGLSLDPAWRKGDAERFDTLLHGLFLTRAELEALGGSK